MDLFVDAYIWMFGGTKKAAREVYRKADHGYISAVIESYTRHFAFTFYED